MLLCSSFASAAPGPSVSFDEGQPSSPDTGKLKATGTYNDGGAISSRVEVWYREKGTTTWSVGTAGTSSGAWIYQTTGLKSNTIYEVKPVLSYIPQTGGNQVLEGITKEVTIK